MQIIKSRALRNLQSGAVLVTALVLMMVLAIIGVASMRSNSTDIGIHKSMRNRANAFQCAEAAIRTAELIMENMTALPSVVTSKPTDPATEVWDYNASEIQNIFSKDRDWWNDHGSDGTDMTNADYQVGCAEVPKFIIEKLGVVDDGSGVLEISERSKSGVDYFRITAFSVGMETNASVLLQTTFAKRLR